MEWEHFARYVTRRNVLLCFCVVSVVCGSLAVGNHILRQRDDDYLYSTDIAPILSRYHTYVNLEDTGLRKVRNGAAANLKRFRPCSGRAHLASYDRASHVLTPGTACRGEHMLEFTTDAVWPGEKDVRRHWMPLSLPVTITLADQVDPVELPGTVHIEVRCKAALGGVRGQQMIQTVIPITPASESRRASPRRIRNVVSLKFDALSRVSAMRYMPRYIEKVRAANAEPSTKRKWRGYTMGSYHVLGPNTQVNEVPYLTGQSHTRQPFTNDHGFFPFGDDYTWIWDEYRRAGYKIGYGSQNALNMMGYCLGLPDARHRFDFLYRGVDCEGRSCARFRMINSYPSDPMCFGDVPMGVEFVRYIADALAAGAGEGGVAFFTDFLETHNCNSPMTAAHVEDAALEAVAQLMEARDDTLLVVYGDHGQHYGKLYNTPWGRVDHRLPLLQVLAPQWWLDEHPDTEAALDANQHEIVTMYDLHATLRHLLTHPTSFSEVGPGIIETMDNPHARSLLDPVRTHPDAYRTCGEAGLDHASCVLSPGSMKVILTPPAIMVDIIEAVVDHVNGHTASHRSPADRPGDGCLEVFIEGDIISGFINGMVRAGATGDIYDVNVRIQPYACTFGAVVEVAHDGLITVHSVAHTSPYAKFETCFAKAEGVPSGMCLCQFPGGPVPASKQDK